MEIILIIYRSKTFQCLIPNRTYIEQQSPPAALQKQSFVTEDGRSDLSAVLSSDIPEFEHVQRTAAIRAAPAESEPNGRWQLRAASLQNSSLPLHRPGDVVG